MARKTTQVQVPGLENTTPPTDETEQQQDAPAAFVLAEATQDAIVAHFESFGFTDTAGESLTAHPAFIALVKLALKPVQTVEVEKVVTKTVHAPAATNGEPVARPKQVLTEHGWLVG